MTRPDDLPGRRALRAATGRLGAARRRFERSTCGRLYRRGVEVDLVDQATVLAAVAFLAVLPALITIAAVAPEGAVAGADGWGRRLGLSAPAAEDLQLLLPTTAAVRGGTTAVGVVLTVAAAAAWPKALQHGYETAWRLPPNPRRPVGQRSLWLATLVLGLLLSGVTAGLATGWVRTALVVVAGLPLFTAWCWWSQHLLLGGRVPWRRLLRGAVATGVGLTGLRLAAGGYLSRSIEQNFDQYGSLGTATSLLGWLVALGVVLLGGPLLGAVLDERPSAPRPVRRR